MAISKPFLILQIRPEDDTSNSEFEAILKYGGLDKKDVCRIRIEKAGIPDLKIEDYIPPSILSNIFIEGIGISYTPKQIINSLNPIKQKIHKTL